MSSSLQISITFLEGMNSRLREIAVAKAPPTRVSTTSLAARLARPGWLLSVLNSVMAVSLLLLAAGVLQTWR